MNLFWAAHAVHHQSEDYNLAVALRQAVLTPLTSLPFALPLAMLGVSPLIYIASEALSTLYQFWIHTEVVGRLGPLERVLNTPAHHRVHHARNPGYIDRNYGAILIVWDRWFGTYAPEVETPIYGIAKPFRSFNPLWAQAQPLLQVVDASLRAPRLRDRLRVLLAPPERTFHWEGAGGVAARELHAAKFERSVRGPLRRYLLVNFALAVAATFCLMLWSERLPRSVLAVGAALVLLAMLSVGGLIEARRWARPLELARVVLTAVAVVWFAHG